MAFEHLKTQLAALSRGFARRRAWVALLGSGTTVAVLLVLFVAGDHWLRFPPAICWAVWLAAVTALVVGVGLAVARLCCAPSLPATALLAEKRLSYADNRLINAVQLGQGGHSHVAERLSERIPEAMWKLRGSQLVSSKPLIRCVRILGVAAVIFAGVFVANPSAARRSVARFVLPMAGLPPLTDTRIVSLQPGETVVPRGGNLSIKAVLDGKIPAVARLQRRRLPDEKVEEARTSVAPADNGVEAASAAFELDGLAASFEYRVRAGDAASPWQKVIVQHPPDLASWRARVIPPEYTGQPRKTLTDNAEKPAVPQGSTIALHGTTTAELRGAAVQHPDFDQGEKAVGTDGTSFEVTFPALLDPAPELRLVSSEGLESRRSLPFRVSPDAPPTLQLVDTPLRQEAPEAEHSVPVTFRARDDYAVSRVGIERVRSDGRAQPVNTAAPSELQPEFAGRFVLELDGFDPAPGDELRFRLWAEDNGPNAAERRAQSPVLAIRIPAESTPESDESAVQTARDRLAEIVDLQRRTLAGTRGLEERCRLTGELDVEKLLELRTSQRQVRGQTLELLESAPPLGDLVNVLQSLGEHEMVRVLDAFERVRRQPNEQKPTALLRVVELQETILASLTGVSESVPAETRHQQRVDLFAALQDLIKEQRNTLKNTRELSGAPAENPDLRRTLAKRQDRLAQDYLDFQDLCNRAMDAPGEDTFAEQVRRAYDALREARVYERMLGAAEELELGELNLAEERESIVLEHLIRALDILNSWRADNAKKRVADASDTIRKTVDALEEMEKKQARIAEVTRDITKRGMENPEVRDELGAMDEQQEEMKDLIEELAQDLYQFPELPVCNEMNAKMRELFEDVQQAMDSENAPSAEIAVQKEDSFLDAMRKTKERAEDIEMWLPDTPDTIAWNMESFDADEFPDMPLVPLPDELEDLVGDLLDQSEQAEMDAQDATGNNMMADGVMGWDVMDGPIPNFSAKGKSGNTKPNDNEMTGRSGAGREGQSSGELVEDHVKGLEGRETHARRTRDPLQEGQVTEDEESTLEARSTGGGKLGGESESQGMFGNSPRRDLHTPAHGNDHQALRQETEALYAKARLLYLKTGKLGLAARDLRSMEDSVPDMQSFDSLGRKVLRRLSESQVEIREGVALPMPVQSATRSGGAGVRDIDLSAIDSEYRHLIGDYYRSLSK